jgi:sporulation protein YlmC with PRC-barrel domain
MESRYLSKGAVHMLTVGSLLMTLGTTLTVPAQAADNNRVLKASEMIGMNVENTEGKALGDIRDLVIDPEDGSVQYAVLEFGGFAGVGDKYFAVPWEALQLDQEHKKIALDVSKKDLKDAPGFDKDHWPDLSQEQHQIAIYEFYEVPSDRETALQSRP